MKICLSEVIGCKAYAKITQLGKPSQDDKISGQRNKVPDYRYRCLPSLVWLPEIETIVKLVKTCAEDTTEGTMKFTNIRRKLLAMTIPGSGE